MTDCQIADSGHERPARRQRVGAICAGENGDQFLAAIARDHVARSARGRTEGTRDLAQALVTRRMSVAIVVGLEVIDIEHDHGQ